MMSNTIPPIGWKARDFRLQGIDGKTYSLAEVRGPKGTLVIFICNHCPYVKASINRIVAEAKALREIGIGTIAIMPNDTEAYPEDSFDNMKAFAAQHGFTFSYIIAHWKWPAWLKAQLIKRLTNVRFGSKPDVRPRSSDVRFTPESGHSPTRSGCLLWADTVAKVAAYLPDGQKWAIIESKQPDS
jgi:peroxiredoxin